MPSAIHDVVVQALRIIPTAGGPVLHMLRADSPLFRSFGEVYFSEVEVGQVKGWKRHKRQTQYFSVPVGLLKVVLYDARENSPSQGKLMEVILGRPDNYQLLLIPPLVWYSFSAIGGENALICNCTDVPHDPEESERLPLSAHIFPYRW